MKLILASASPQKKSLLNKLGIPFEIFPTEINKTPNKDEKAETFVRRIALNEAEIASKARKGDIVITHEVIIEFEGKIIDKVASSDEAKKILGKFSSKVHNYVSATVVMRDGEALYQGSQTTIVKFKKLSKGEIEEYVKGGEGMESQGAYLIQGDGGMFIESIDGSYFNIVGLPLQSIVRALEKQGYKVIDDVKRTIEMQEKSIKESFPR
jgi:septum formation protein